MTVRIQQAHEAIRRARGVTPEHGAVAEVFYADVDRDVRPPSSTHVAGVLGLDPATTKRVLYEVRCIGQAVLADTR